MQIESENSFIWKIKKPEWRQDSNFDVKNSAIQEIFTITGGKWGFRTKKNIPRTVKVTDLNKMALKKIYNGMCKWN